MDWLRRVRSSVWTPACGRIGLMPETLQGFRWMTVAEHLRFVARFYDTWDEAYARELLEDVEWLAERVLVLEAGRLKGDQPIAELRSTGQPVAEALYALLVSE